jgi:K+-sensing histidine kinase KdpD
MLLNARRIVSGPTEAESHRILLAIEDITARKELDRQKDTLLGIASHELKTPITSAKLTLQMLRRRLTKAGNMQSTTQLREADAQLNRLTCLLDGILDTTAIETGRLSLQRALFAVDDLVRETCEELQYTTPLHHIVFAQEAHTEVYGDRVRTGEVLSNLLANAIKYTPPEKPIEVRAVSDTEQVTISVQDHGKGIPQDQQASIFERFSRMGDSSQKRQPGVGLGLYLAAEITKQQKGRIWIESVSEEGATFFFTVPQHSASEVCEASASEESIS